VLNANLVAMCRAVWWRVLHEVSHAEYRRHGSVRYRGAAVADGKPPTGGSAGRASGDRHFNLVSSGIRSSQQT
jgi:hypothetical protein